MDNADVAVMERGETDVAERLPVQAEEGGAFELAKIENPTAAIEVAERLVKKMADKCSGPEYIAPIQGKRYPKVEWWTTVGASLGLFPREESNKRLDREDEIAYEASVAVYRGDQLITRASAICSSKEKTWSGRDEYAIRSMAATRATAKAFRIGLSFLATLAGLEATPAEEVPSGGFTDDRPFDLDNEVGFGKHKDLTWRELADQQPGYIRWLRDNTDRLTDEMAEALFTLIEGFTSEALNGQDDLDLTEPASEEQVEQIQNLYLPIAPHLTDAQKERVKAAMKGTEQQAEKTIKWLHGKIDEVQHAHAGKEA